MVSVCSISIKRSSVFFLITVCSFYTVKSIAQVSGEIPEFKLAVPPSPNASAFMQYGNYPTVLNTGTIPISIPLYEINTGKIVVPISADYHASGIKVGQLPGSIGLGWTLNAGGLISRVMKGIPDENTQYGYLNIGAQLKPAANFDYNSLQDRELLKGLLDGDIDGSPDKFSINALGLNAQFNYDKNKLEIIVPFQQIKIEGGLGDNLDYYTVTDEAGTIFRFGKSFSGADTKEVSQARVKGPDPDPYVSSWYLTEIISADKSDTVFFEYESVYIGLYSTSRSQQYQHAFQYSGSLPNGQAAGYSTEFGHEATLYATSRFWELSPVNVTTQSITNSQNIKKITYRGGKIEFTNYAYLTGLKRVDELIVYERDLSSPVGYTEIKRHKFEYGFFNGPAARLKLVSITEGKNNELLPVHQFYYHEQFIMPEYDSPNCDMWGFFNGALNGNFIPPHLVGGLVFGDANRSVDSTYMKTNVLNKIVYPTGGYSKFYYEPHILNTTVFGGGLRIQKVMNFDSNNGQLTSKSYQYQNEFLTASTLQNTYQISNSVLESYKDIVTSFTVGYAWNYETYFANSEYYNAPEGSPLSYKKVIEFQGTPSINSGKTEYEFWEIQDYGASYSYPFPSLHSNAELRSKLLKKSEFVNLQNGQYQKNYEEINTYSIYEQGESSGLLVKWMTKQHKQADGLPLYNTAAGYLFVMNEFQKSNFVQLDQTEKIDNLLNTKTLYTYNKKPAHFQVTAIESTNSNNIVSKKEIKYAKDYSEISGLTPSEIQSYQKMITDNILNIPVQVAVIKGGNLESKNTTTYKLVGTIPIPEKSKLEYPDLSTKSVSLTFNQHFRLTQTTPVNNIAEAYIWDASSTKPLARIVNATIDQVAYTSFESDGKGNWIFSGPTYSDIVSKTGKSYYKLGGGQITRILAPGKYRLQFWAKGTVTLSGGTIVSNGVASADLNGWNNYQYELTIGSATTLVISGTSTAFIDELKIYPANAQMTTYTYGAAVGITAVSDTNNFVSYYEYDSLGRLQVTRDNNRNILKQVDYHYKGN